MRHFRCRSRLAAIVAVTFGVATGGATAIAAQDEHARQSAASDNQVAQAQSATAPAASGDDATKASKQNPKADTSKQKMKHPATAQMDKATPTEKTPSDKPATKHPPTSAMDNATPDEKSPKSSQ